MVLLLTAAEVQPLLDLDSAIALTEDVFAEYGRGEVDVHAPYHLFVREGALCDASAREAISGMDVVPTSTRNRQSLFPFDWVDKSTHLSSMGPISELDPDVLPNCDRLVVSSKIQEEHYFIKTKPIPLVDLIEARRRSLSRGFVF